MVRQIVTEMLIKESECINGDAACVEEMIKQRDKGQRPMNKEKESERALDKLRKESAKLKAALSEEKISNQQLIRQGEMEDEKNKAKCLEILSKLKEFPQHFSAKIFTSSKNTLIFDKISPRRNFFPFKH